MYLDRLPPFIMNDKRWEISRSFRMLHFFSLRHIYFSAIFVLVCSEIRLNEGNVLIDCIKVHFYSIDEMSFQTPRRETENIYVSNVSRFQNILIMINRQVSWLIDWLIVYCLSTRSNLFYFTQRRHLCWWGAAKVGPVFRANGLWAGRGLYRAKPAVTRGLGFCGLSRRIALLSPLVQQRSQAMNTKGIF